LYYIKYFFKKASEFTDKNTKITNLEIKKIIKTFGFDSDFICKPCDIKNSSKITLDSVLLHYSTCKNKDVKT